MIKCGCCLQTDQCVLTNNLFDPSLAPATGVIDKPSVCFCVCDPHFILDGKHIYPASNLRAVAGKQRVPTPRCDQAMQAHPQVIASSMIFSKTLSEAWCFSSPCLAALWAWTPQAGRGGSLMERSWAYLCLHEHRPRWDISQDSAERGLQPIQWQGCVRRSALLISGDYISQIHGLGRVLAQESKH